MRKPAPKTVPPSRAEATPLRYLKLTRDQRRAGLEIAATLRAMADEPWSAPHGSPQEHGYLPHLDRTRSNRVLLIDGGRGTGKSTLLLTLLNVYKSHVLGAQEPQGFEGMAEMIIPVDLLDLQPLPPSTNLALHVLGRLKSVVDAVEPPSASTPSKPLWDEPSGNRLRDKWNRLMRLLATWDESLEARVGRQDASSYVVEIVEEELERGQLSEGFRDAVDALVDGYASKFGRGSSKKPLFVVTIDDADMNPKLSARLLELLRKLWHPRLVFLMAGDSELFLVRLKEALLAQGSRVSKDGKPYLRLAHDIYDKDIPNSARFLLGALRPDERVKRDREIYSLLRRFPIDAHPPEIPRRDASTPPTLRDYFLTNIQSSELLPERLRQISELTARLRRESPPGEGMTPARAMPPIVQWLWQQTVARHSEDDERWKQLGNAVQSSRLDGQLRLDTRRIRLRPVMEPSMRFRVEPTVYKLTLQTMNRFNAVMRVQEAPYLELQTQPAENLPEQLTACWVLASDLAADSRQESPLDVAENPIDEGAVRFVLAARPASNLEPELEVPWPLPAWQAPVDYVLFSKHWNQQLEAGHASPTRDASLLARNFLWLVIQICQHRTVKSAVEWNHSPSWAELAEKLVELSKPHAPSSPRQQQCARWAITAAPLIAAPESGLPQEEARAFLDALVPMLGVSWSIKDIRAQRLSRLTEMPGRTRSNFDPERALELVDGAVPTHPFVQALKGLHIPSNRQGGRRSLFDDIEHRSPPPHSGLFKDKDFRLGRYRTELRQESLGDLPESLYSSLREKIESRSHHSSIVPVVLTNLWKSLAQQAGRPDVLPWFWLDRTRLRMSDKAEALGHALREAVLNSRGDLITSIRIDPLRELVIERFAPAAPASDLPVPLEALFRLLFDYIQDQEDDSGPVDQRLAIWPLVSTRFSGKKPYSLHPWPDVRWPSLKEYEDAPKDWAKRVAAADEWLALETPEYKPYAVDTFALMYLENRAASYQRSHSGSINRGEVTADDYKEFLGRRLPSGLGGRRSEFLTNWVKQLPLMATPEAGLSDEIARVFLESARLQGLTRAQLQKMRRERTLADGIPSTQVDATLAEIDRQFHHHPWVEHTKKSSGK
jgi:hypothetical protein